MRVATAPRRVGGAPGRRSRAEARSQDEGAQEDGRELHGPYLRSFRAQPKRRVSARVIALLLLAASLLFLKVWERTVSNSLSMERDRLAREVRTLENRIRITRDLEEQAAFRSGIDLTSLSQLGFQNPDPARVVDVDLACQQDAPLLNEKMGTNVVWQNRYRYGDPEAAFAAADRIAEHSYRVRLASQSGESMELVVISVGWRCVTLGRLRIVLRRNRQVLS